MQRRITCPGPMRCCCPITSSKVSGRKMCIRDRLKLLVTDLDGTLLKIGNELSAGISDENREALTEFVREGGHVAIASSRGPDAQTMISGLLGVPVAAIGMNGFIVLDEEGEKISEHWMDFADFAELVEFIQKHQINGSLITRGDDNGAYVYGCLLYTSLLIRPAIKSLT